MIFNILLLCYGKHADKYARHNKIRAPFPIILRITKNRSSYEERFNFVVIHPRLELGTP